MNQLNNTSQNTHILTASKPSGLFAQTLSTPYNLYYVKTTPVKSKASEVQPFKKVKVFNELITNIVRIRELNNTYSTNKLLKNYAFFLQLQSLSSSGVIKNITRPTAKTLQYFNCSKRTWITRVGECIKAGFVTRKANTLILVSNNDLLESFDCTDTSFMYVNIQPDIKLSDTLKAHVIRLQQIKQEQQFSRNIKKVKEYYEYLQINLPRSRNIRKEILEQQKLVFRNGTTTTEFASIINMFNADNNLQARKLRTVFGLKSYKSVAYLKKRLEKLKLIEVERNRKVESLFRSRKPKPYYVSYSVTNKSTIWHLCDGITVTAGLYAK